jgi:hypothetical protein
MRELSKPTGDIAETISYQAGQVWNMRQLKFATDQPVGEMLFNLSNLAEGQSLAVSLAMRQLDYQVKGKNAAGQDIVYGRNPSVIPTDNPMELMRLVEDHKKANPDTPFISATHTRPDKVSEVLIAPADMPKSEVDFFAKTGYLHGQQVGFGGHDGWVIETVLPLQGKQRTARVELRNLATDERIRDVRTTQLTRLNSDAPGDLRLHGRTPFLQDVFEPARALDLVPTGPAGVQPSPEVFDMFPEALKADRAVYNAAEEGSAIPSHLSAEFSKSPERQAFIDRMKKEVGDVMVVHRVGPPKDGIQSFFTDPLTHAGEKVRSFLVKTEDIAFPVSADHGELAINSSKVQEKKIAATATEPASVGPVFYKRDRANPERLTRYTDKSLQTHILEDFLDHIGATPDGKFTLTPDDIVAYAGFGENGTSFLGERGESIEALKGRLDRNRLEQLKGDGIPRLFTESKKPLTYAEAREKFREQLRSDAIPTLRDPESRLIDRTNMSWNDIVTSYAQARGLKAEMIPKVAEFLRNKIGNELLGQNTIRSRLADETSIPILQATVDRSTALINKLREKQSMTPEENKAFMALSDTRDVFAARIEQIKNAGPLPFTDHEREVYSRLMTEAEKEHDRISKDLVKSANANGYTVEREGSYISLRDGETNVRLPQRFLTSDEALAFVNDAGRPKGIDLDGGGNNTIPPSAVVPNGMPAPDPAPRLWEVPHQFHPNSTIDKIMSLMDTVAPWATPKRAFMVALDNTFKTRFYDQVYLPLQTAHMKTMAVMRPFMKQLKDVESILRKEGTDRERWQVISQYRESMAPQEVIDNLFKDRKLTSAEQDYANKLATNKIDISNVYSYRRAVGEMNKGFQSELADLQAQINQTQDPMQLSKLRKNLDDLHRSHQVDLQGARTAFNIDEKHQKAVDMFDEIVKRNVNEVSLNGVTRLASAIMGNEKSRPQFAAENKMTSGELEAARKIDALYHAVAEHHGIDERLTQYLNHFRKYTELPDATPAALRKQVLKGAMKDTPQLASELIRSGEMNVYEMDPINAMYQYINTTFKNRYFNPVWKDAVNAATEHLNQIPKGRDKAAQVINEYIQGLRGVPASTDQLAQTALNEFFNKMKVDLHPDLQRDIVSTWLAAQSGAFLGFRVAQGVRDFTQFSKIYYSRMGTSRYLNGLKLAYERDANGMRRVESLALEGKIPGLSVLQFASEDEVANGMAGKAGRVKDAIFAASELGLKVSGQHNAYGLAHAIAYLDTQDIAGKALLELSRGKITKEAAYKRLRMNSYDVPVAEGFDRLVTDGKFNEASEYLAQTTGAETAFLFGMQNHPYGWGTAKGRLFGSFGTWSVWDRNFLTRLAGRGTALERAGSMARLASAEMATLGAGRTLGLNIRGWYLIPGMLFGGGPAFEYTQQLEDAVGMHGSMRAEIARKQLTRVSNGQVPVLSQIVPGASALSDYYKAYQLQQNRYGPVVLGQALGFSVDQTQRSFLDEMMGNFPRLRK